MLWYNVLVKMAKSPPSLDCRRSVLTKHDVVIYSYGDKLYNASGKKNWQTKESKLIELRSFNHEWRSTREEGGGTKGDKPHVTDSSSSVVTSPRVKVLPISNSLWQNFIYISWQPRETERNSPPNLSHLFTLEVGLPIHKMQWGVRCF